MRQQHIVSTILNPTQRASLKIQKTNKQLNVKVTKIPTSNNNNIASLVEIGKQLLRLQPESKYTNSGGSCTVVNFSCDVTKFVGA